MLLKQSHGFLGNILLFEEWLLRKSFHLLLKQAQMVRILTILSELVEKLINFVSTLVAFIKIQSNQGGLHEWQDFFQKPFLIPLDHVFIKSVI